MGNRIRIWSVVTLLGVASTAWPNEVRAGGFEYPAAGTRPLGRGGAFYARADDPMALLYNPANLAALSGVQVGFDLHVGLLDACFDRAGSYTDNSGGADGGTRFGSAGDPPPTGYDGVEFPPVCNSGPPGWVPELALTLRIMEELGIGFGLVAPASVGHTKWGSGRDGTIAVDPSVHESGRLPSPARYKLVEEDLILFWPSVGAGYAPHPRVRFGLTFGWGIGVFDFFNYTQPFASEALSTDIKTQLHAKDLFVPRVTASVHTVPHDNLDITAAFTWVDDVSAEGGLELTSGAFRVDGEGNPAVIQERVDRCDGVPWSASESCVEPVHGVRLEAPQPWQLAFAVRYAHRTRPRAREGETVGRLSGRVEDPMANELFDVELDVVYERNSRVDELFVLVPEHSTLLVDDGVSRDISERNRIPHQWKDQWSIRLGGDYNVVPGVLALRGGVSYETPGVKKAYPQIDFFPFQRVGLHAGLTLRIQRFEISVAYAHMFQKTQTVRPAGPGCEDAADLGHDRTCRGKLEDLDGDGETETHEVTNQRGVPQVAATDALGAPYIVNEGRITSNLDVVSVGVRYHF